MMKPSICSVSILQHVRERVVNLACFLIDRLSIMEDLFKRDNDIIGLLLEAVNFAAIKHRDQRRKDGHQTPYINHPIGVAHLIWKEGGVTDIAVLQVREIPNDCTEWSVW